jgi:FPC/CPF motif-containing protein YcgG
VNPFLSQDPALKARRLARALVSDIVVYHPAKRQEGLRDGTLKELFEEEIRKSYEEYTEQGGRPLAESTGYFREALNEILAGGRQIF